MPGDPIPQYPSIVAMLEATAQAFPGREAVVFGAARWSYSQLKCVVAGLARLVRERAEVAARTQPSRGAGSPPKGAESVRIATLLPNSLLACAAPYAVAAAGAQLVPLNPLYTPRELQY